MKISSKTNYALLTVLDLTMYRNTGVIKVTDIAKRQGIHHKFLEQILLLLRNGGIVKSKRGAHGGYFLARLPDKISLASIIHLTETDILSGRSEVTAMEGSVFDDIWGEIDGYITEKLGALNMQQVADRAAAKLKVLEFSI